MDMHMVLSLMGSILILTGCIIYNWDMWWGKTTPNAATWCLAAFNATLTGISYLVMTGDTLKSITPLTGALTTMTIFLLSLGRGKFSPLTRIDCCTLGIGIMAMAAWQALDSPMMANLISMATSIISFLPTYKGVWQGTNRERPLPWFIWTTGVAVSLVVVLLRWRGHYEDLVWGMVFLLLNGGVGILALWKNRREANG